MTQTVLEATQDASAEGRSHPHHWLSVVSHLHPRYGGMSAAVPQLGLEVQRNGPINVDLASFCAHEESYLPHGYSQSKVSQWPASRVAWMHHPGLRRDLRKIIDSADGIHVHGLWEQSTAIVCKMARQMGRPYIISAHGMLEPWAMKTKSVKKYLYAALCERANVRNASCLHALTCNEAASYRRFGARCPVAIIPNGVNVPSNLSSETFFRQFPGLRHKRILLFMSRLHPKKGLDMLVSAWAALAKQFPDAHLVIVGPDFEGMQATLEQAVAQKQLGEHVSFTGMLSGRVKWSALAAAECFLLPSYSEGLSMSVLEAMAAGLPVIVTKPCNMPEVSRHSLGWEIEPRTDHLIFAIQSALGNPRQTNQEIGSRGKQMIEQRYSWPTIGRQMSQLYEWVQGGPLPQDVEVLHG